MPGIFLQGCGSGSRFDHGERRQGGSGPGDDAFFGSPGKAGQAADKDAKAMGAGSRERGAGSGATGCFGEEVSQGGERVGVAVGFSGSGAFERSGKRIGETPSPARESLCCRGETSGGASGLIQAGYDACFPAFLCAAFAGGRRGHQDAAGVAGSRGCEDDGGLCPCLADRE